MKNTSAQYHSLLLLRGLPGSGKTALAALLSEKGKYPVFSIDDYFINEKGEYEFEFQNNHLAYKFCEEQTENAMQDKKSKIFVANTFTQEWEMAPYFKLASKHDYQLFVMTVENRHNGKNIHNIPREQLEKMAVKYKVQLIPEI